MQDSFNRIVDLVKLSLIIIGLIREPLIPFGFEFVVIVYIAVVISYKKIKILIIGF